MEGDMANEQGIDRGIIGNCPEEKRGGSGHSDVSKGGKVVTVPLHEGCPCGEVGRINFYFKWLI